MAIEAQAMRQPTAEELIREEIGFTQANVLEKFILGSLDDNAVTPEIKSVKSLTMLPEHWSYNNPESVNFVAQTWLVNHNPLLNVDWFARGVSVLIPFTESESLSDLQNLTMQAMEQVERTELYPDIVEKYQDRYARVVRTILENGIVSLRPRFLSYNAGIWWAIGHYKDFDKIRIKNTERVFGTFKVSDPADHWIEAQLVERISRGVLEA